MKPKSKKTDIKKLKKECFSLWSEIIRNRYNNTCIMCPKSKADGWVVQAHHAISRAAQGNHAKYDVRNGVCLCYNCHINKLHGEQGDYEFQSRYSQLIDVIFPDELKESIITDSKIVIKDKQLPDIKEKLAAILQSELQS